MKSKIITIFGGSGFVGSHIVKELAKSNDTIRIICRNPVNAMSLKILGSVGQIVVVKGSINDDYNLKNLVRGSDIVINLVGLLYERKKNDFYNTHNKAVSALASVCSELGISQFIHFSALGVDINQSEYARTKRQGEIEAMKNFHNINIIRPSIIFGKEDNFINKFKNMSNISFFLPLIDGGNTKFQPVFVDDIAKIVTILTRNKLFCGKIIELAGPKIYSFKEILQYILLVTNRKRLFINLNLNIAKIMGKIFDIFSSNPVITEDQITSLQYDNIIHDDNTIKFRDFNIEPKSLEETEKFLNI